MHTLNWIPMVALLGAGCVVQNDEPEGSGTVAVSWQVGASGCEAAGVTDVEVTIGTRSNLFACSDGMAEVILGTGNYTLEAVGIDENGFARYASAPEEVVVLPGQVTQVQTLRLEALPGVLEVNWFFANGRLCGSNGVTKMDIALFQDDQIEYDLQTECDDGIEVMSDITAGTYTVSIFGTDDSGVSLFEGTIDTNIDRGDFASVDVEMVEL